MLASIYINARNEAEEMLQKGYERTEILTLLVNAAEQAAGSEAVVSILVLDNEGLLRNGASPKLPADYLKAIDGIKPDANVGTCAAAAATGKMVITPSFYADNKWSELRHLPTAIGFVGAWSMPIIKADKVLGTFGTYFRQHREPSFEEINGVRLLAETAALVLMAEN